MRCLVNLNSISSDLHRYKQATFRVASSVYAVTGSVRLGYSLWLLSEGRFGPKRDLIATFSTLHALAGYVEDNS